MHIVQGAELTLEEKDIMELNILRKALSNREPKHMGEANFVSEN